MEKLKEMINEFSGKPMSEQVYTVAGKRYCVVSHYTGEKDIDSVLLGLAKKNAYAVLGKSSA